MTKSDREAVRMKYNNRCAYCGCELVKGWHVDELLPVRRNYKWVNGHYALPDGTPVRSNSFTEEEGIDRGIKWVESKQVPDGCMHPERLHIDNQMPACASCNINKHSMSLEEFRAMITGFINSLNQYNTQYKIAKRYGLIQETIKPVVFYFETLIQHP